MRWIALAALFSLPALPSLPAAAAELNPKTLEAFDRYIRETEERRATSRTFLWAD